MMYNQVMETVYFVGIKGTGVCALAELMYNAGIRVSGSDTPEEFYTDAILKELKIPYHVEFDAAHINTDINMVIHSAAYSVDSNPELAKAMQLKIPILKYPEALGAWSSRFDSSGICGVHGKTTTTALAGVCARAAGIPAQILVGSAVADFGGRSTLTLGDKFFIAETCEYRKHFLEFHPKTIILTSVESDHQDYFSDYESIRDAFVEYCRLLPPGGKLIYCADDPGASEVAKVIKQDGKAALIPYGFNAAGDYKITSYDVKDEKIIFALAGFQGVFKLQIPGRHQVLNAAAAIALTLSLIKKEFNTDVLDSIRTALENFIGTKRRSEIIGKSSLKNGDIIFMDDYGHHPTAIKTTLAGLKSFYPARRIIVSFMSHTYTRTYSLLDDFAAALCGADVLFLHKIYASARESFSGKISGRDLYEKTKALFNNHNGLTASPEQSNDLTDGVFYIEEPDDAFDLLCELLRPGDLFITIGAGNNWSLGKKLYSYFKGKNYD